MATAATPPITPPTIAPVEECLSSGCSLPPEDTTILLSILNDKNILNLVQER